MSKLKNAYYKLPEGAVLNNRYEIRELLGAGGFGNTYLARDTRFSANTIFVCVKEFFLSGQCVRAADGRTVALSDPVKQANFEDMRRRFRREAERMFTLKDEHIVRVSDLFDENATSYYVMEYVAGRSLAQIVAQSGQVDEPEALGYILQLLKGLRVIHRIGMVHLDIKPGNVMVDAEGKVVLIDFGASKIIEPGAATLSAAMLNTPGYAPLEQTLVRIDRIGEWTDLYAVGGTLFKLVTGHTPANAQEIIDEGEAAFKFPDHVSQPVRELIKWMMNKRISERPHSADEVISRIENQLSDKQPLSQPEVKPEPKPAAPQPASPQPASASSSPTPAPPKPAAPMTPATPLFAANSPKKPAEASPAKPVADKEEGDISVLTDAEAAGMDFEDAVAVAEPAKAKLAVMEAETVILSKPSMRKPANKPAASPNSAQSAQPAPQPATPYSNPMVGAATNAAQSPYGGYPQGQPSNSTPYSSPASPYAPQQQPYGTQQPYAPQQPYAQQQGGYGYDAPYTPQPAGMPFDDKTQMQTTVSNVAQGMPNIPYGQNNAGKKSSKGVLLAILAFVAAAIVALAVYFLIIKPSSSSSVYDNYFDGTETTTSSNNY